ncbi:MAG: GNAT family N-acetyltransferase [Candidatus Diapherotrites archaeon]|nr:GNAT family N-acetyltransferase [Candidatus Diapherotrites archaeon]
MTMTTGGRVIEIVQDMDRSISVMYNAGTWLKTSGKKLSKWRKPENLNRDFLLQYVKPDEFYVVLVNGRQAAAAILQFDQNSQDWKCVDKNKTIHALYIHWLCVEREYTSTGLPKVIMDFAEQKAIENGIIFLRADTNAQIMKLMKIYEKLGFDLISIEQKDYRQTAFYQKPVRK